MAERLLFAEEVAEILGVRTTQIKQYLSNAKRVRRDGLPHAEEFPEPAARVQRAVHRGGDRHDVATWSNLWRPADLAAYVEMRPESRYWPAERREQVAAQLRDDVFLDRLLAAREVA